MGNTTTRDFVSENFEYLKRLKEASIDLSTNRYLLEYIANGFAKYGSVTGFIHNIDKWIRSLVKIYPELGFDHETNQIKATVDLADQLILLDQELMEKLSYISNVQSMYGLLITYEFKGQSCTTTLSRFFEFIEDRYPLEEDRYKGLGSSDATVSKEIIMDPKTRRIIRVTMDDVESMRKMGVLVGKSKQNNNDRKELMLNFEGTFDMIDN